MTTGDWGGPIADGTINFTRDGNTYTLEFDCLDDAGNAVKGTLSGIVGEHINQCPELYDDTLLPAL